jgi:drug/metabolite transporter (DMT)-like permease
MNKQQQAYLYGVVAVLFWSTIASAFKVSLRYLDTLQLLFHASLVSIAVLFLILFFQRKLHLLRAYHARDYVRSALLGFLNPFLYYAVLLKAYELLRAQEAMTLNYTWPIVLALLSIPLLKQRIGWKSIAAILTSFIGVIIIATGGNVLSLRFTNGVGVVLALSSTFIWSLFWLYNVRDRRDEVPKLFLNFAFGFVYVVIATLVFSRLHVPSWKALLGASYIGCFEMGITFVLWLRALQLTKTAARIANLIYLSPFLGLFIINRVVGERILWATVAGLALIVVGILLQTKKGDRLLLSEEKKPRDRGRHFLCL